MVREGGLEPPRFYSLAPQTSVSTIPPSAQFDTSLTLSQGFWRVKPYFLVFSCIEIELCHRQTNPIGGAMILKTLVLGLAVILFTNCSTWPTSHGDRNVSEAGRRCEVNAQLPPMFSVLENTRERIVVELGDIAEKFNLDSGFEYKVIHRGSKEDRVGVNTKYEAQETEIVPATHSDQRKTRIEVPVVKTGVYIFKVYTKGGFFGRSENVVWLQKVFALAPADSKLSEEQKKSLAEQYTPVISMHKDELYFPVSLDYLTNQIEPDAQLAREPFILTNSYGSKEEKFSYSFNFSEIDSVLPHYGHAGSVLKSGLKSSSDSRLVSRYGKNNVTVYYSVFENPKYNEIYINYHFFYSYDPKNGTPAKPALAGHIFDRESMTVVLRSTTKNPISVFYGAHLPSQGMNELDTNGREVQERWFGGRVFVNWPKVIKNAGRPVPAVALGSHGIYPREANYGVYLNSGTATKVLEEPAGGDRLLYPEFAEGVEKTATSYPYKLRNLSLDSVTSDCNNPNHLLAFSGATVDVLGSGNATFPPFTDREEDYNTYADSNSPMFDMDKN